MPGSLTGWLVWITHVGGELDHCCRIWSQRLIISSHHVTCSAQPSWWWSDSQLAGYLGTRFVVKWNKQKPKWWRSIHVKRICRKQAPLSPGVTSSTALSQRNSVFQWWSRTSECVRSSLYLYSPPSSLSEATRSESEPSNWGCFFFLFTVFQNLIYWHSSKLENSAWNLTPKHNSLY